MSLALGCRHSGTTGQLSQEHNLPTAVCKQQRGKLQSQKIRVEVKMATLWSEALYMSRKVLCSLSMSGSCSPLAALATVSGMLSAILFGSTGTVGVILRCRKALTLRLPPIRYPCSKICSVSSIGLAEMVSAFYIAEIIGGFLCHPSLRDWLDAGEVELSLAAAQSNLGYVRAYP